MKRDLDALTRRTFDVLVIGGGIYGLTLAYDAAQRGLSVALVERNDFGSGTSFNHLRTLHGGLRYLQTLDLSRARESVRERRTLAVIAPDAVRPLQFVLPLGSSLMRGPLAMTLGFALDAVVARDRNDGVPDSHRLPRGRVVGDTAVWYDYEAVEADRLTFAFAVAAAAHGAVLANHVEATALLFDGPRVTGASIGDVESGRTLEVAARETVNATGGAIAGLLPPDGRAAGARVPMLKAMNLVTRREAGDTAQGGITAAGRTVFMVPWRGRALFGTWESPVLCDPEDTRVSEADVARFIAELNEAYPALRLVREDVAVVHRGIVPAIVRGARVGLAAQEQVVHGNGLTSVAGAKYTTARAVAERLVDGLMVRLGQPAVTCRTATTPLPGRGVPPATGDPLVWAAREEMARTLADAVIRRTGMGSLGFPGAEALGRAASIVGAELGWSEERRQSEIAAVTRFYDYDVRLRT